MTTGSFGGVPARQRAKKDTPLPGREPLNLNQVVAYNLREARERRGWTQAYLAELLSHASGSRVTASTVSSLERTWDGDRRRQFDVHELALYALVLDVPILWFFLPPPGYRGELEGIDQSVLDLYALVVGRNDQIEPMVERLREFGVHDPTSTDEIIERITGQPSHSRQRSFRERRQELLLAVLDAHADALEKAAFVLGDFFDHLRQIGFRGFIAENTNDPIYSTLPEYRQAQGDSASVEEASGSDDETSATSPSRTGSDGALDTGEAGDAAQDEGVSG